MGVLVGVCVGVFVGVCVGVTVGVLVGVCVGVLLGVELGVAVGVFVGVGGVYSISIETQYTSAVRESDPCWLSIWIATPKSDALTFEAVKDAPHKSDAPPYA